MGRRLKRFSIAAVLLVVIIGVLGGVKFMQISMLINFGKAAAASGPPPEAVSTSVAGTGAWESMIEAVGSVAAARGVTISNEVPGVVKAIRFESGAKVRPGQVLVELDASVERAQLASLRARLDLAETNAKRTRRLTESGTYTQAQLDTDEAQLKTLAADAQALQAQIARKTVRAPFAGRLGIRSVNLGQYLNPGTPVTVLESLDAVYVDFTLPQQQLDRVGVGTPVRITLQGSTPPTTINGKVAAVDPTIDPATRAIRLRASAEDKGDQLRAGMFVSVAVVMPEKSPVIFVPATAIVRAPYGNSLYVVEDRKDQAGKPVMGPDGKPAKVARQQFVRLGVARGDFIAVEEGITAGQEIVTAGAFKLRNGAAVMVNNQVKVQPSMNPRPENR